jgi:hypothetical protein
VRSRRGRPVCGVSEKYSGRLAYSRAIPLIAGLRRLGARVLAFDPLLADDEIERTGASAWQWSSGDDAVRVVVTQTADARCNDLDIGWFPQLRLLVDGRNSLRTLSLPETVTYPGIGGRR